MQIIRDIPTLREAIRSRRTEGKHIALVPTMGALHAGHLSLVKQGFEHAQAVVVSIFVNPTQFGPNEDFSKYPRTEEADCKALEGVGATIAYLPRVEDMYPEGAATSVKVAGITSGLCGAFRPGHFDGVATIVTKLFMQVQPDVAIFGEKDYQQLAVIRRFTQDLDIPVQVLGAPVIRESDGLALSSRNRYLAPAERAIAPKLHAILQEAAQSIKSGNAVKTALEKASQAILQAGFAKLDYIELRDAATLAPLEKLTAPARLLVAAYLGTTRLIDNIEVAP